MPMWCSQKPENIFALLPNRSHMVLQKPCALEHLPTPSVFPEKRCCSGMGWPSRRLKMCVCCAPQTICIQCACVFTHSRWEFSCQNRYLSLGNVIVQPICDPVSPRAHRSCGWAMFLSESRIECLKIGVWTESRLRCEHVQGMSALEELSLFNLWRKYSLLCQFHVDHPSFRSHLQNRGQILCCLAQCLTWEKRPLSILPVTSSSHPCLSYWQMAIKYPVVHQFHASSWDKKDRTSVLKKPAAWGTACFPSI